MPAAPDEPDPELLEAVRRRRSTRAFDPARPVAADVLIRVLDAARWAPSSGNAQPWRYIVLDESVPAEREAGRGLLRLRNAWARAAPVLLVSVARRGFPPRPGKPERENPHAWHDVGAASMALSVQAVAEGLAVHQMAGFDREAARPVLGLPDDVDPVAVIALGHPGDVDALPADLLTRETAPRQRRALAEVAVLGSWDGPGVG